MKLHHEVDYATGRKNSYPSIEEQLDMLWHSMNTGEMPKSEPFYSKLKEIKDLHPKNSD